MQTPELQGKGAPKASIAQELQAELCSLQCLQELRKQLCGPQVGPAHLCSEQVGAQSRLPSRVGAG